LLKRGFKVQRLRPDNVALSLDALSAQPPGTVLIDAGRAYGDSWESIKLLRKNPSTRRAAISFYSLKPEYSGGAVRVLDYLSKPVGTSELAQALQQQGFTNEREARTLLVVDDDPGLLEMHARIVQNLSGDYRVLKARNGREALTLIQQEHPDLVLLDLIMPEMDGFEVLDAMQKLETTRDIPVIVLTGQALAEEEMARLHRSVAAVLGKGVFTVEETLDHVKQTLGVNQKQGAEAQRLVRKAMAYLHKHHAKPLTREKVARYVGVSEDYLTRCFQQELHMPPMTYLTRYRINQAKTLLARGEMNVTLVATTVGFSSEFYFSRVFRREVGVTPSSYRRGQRST
jgi:YesN/AraC family two-component response regulator